MWVCVILYAYYMHFNLFRNEISPAYTKFHLLNIIFLFWSIEYCISETRYTGPKLMISDDGALFVFLRTFLFLLIYRDEIFTRHTGHLSEICAFGDLCRNLWAAEILNIYLERNYFTDLPTNMANEKFRIVIAFMFIAQKFNGKLVII